MKESKLNTILITKRLSIGYKNNKKEYVVSSNININLQKGELVGLVGANGIGKSTLLRTLTKVQPHLSGEILINNKALNKLSNYELAKSLSIASDEI